MTLHHDDPAPRWPFTPVTQVPCSNPQSSPLQKLTGGMKSFPDQSSCHPVILSSLHARPVLLSSRMLLLVLIFVFFNLFSSSSSLMQYYWGNPCHQSPWVTIMNRASSDNCWCWRFNIRQPDVDGTDGTAQILIQQPPAFPPVQVLK